VVFWLERHNLEATEERVERIFNSAKKSDSVLSDDAVFALV
jgi:hypothetical protein